MTSTGCKKLLMDVTAVSDEWPNVDINTGIYNYTRWSDAIEQLYRTTGGVQYTRTHMGTERRKNEP